MADQSPQTTSPWSPAHGATLKESRERLKLSVSHVAREIGRSNVYIAKLESGSIKHPDPVAVIDLLGLYDLSVSPLSSSIHSKRMSEWLKNAEPKGENHKANLLKTLIHRIFALDGKQRVVVLSFINEMQTSAHVKKHMEKE